MKKVDASGRAAVGDAVWRANSYAGYITCKVALGVGDVNVEGANILYIDKGCDQTFLDNVDRTAVAVAAVV